MCVGPQQLAAHGFMDLPKATTTREPWKVFGTCQHLGWWCEPLGTR